MVATHLLGIDSGLTVTKAVLFDLHGKAVGIGRAEAPQLFSAPGHVERDMATVWSVAVEAIRTCLANSGVDPASIAGIGVTGHGDGVYPLRRDGTPLGKAVLSLDSRAVDIVGDWQHAGVLARSLELTGQQPSQAAPAAVLAWIKEHQPDRYADIGWAVSCKDWLRFQLTGIVATDTTEASVSFTNVNTQTYDPAVLSLFGLDELATALPPILAVTDVVGTVTAAAAGDTGLVPGTPVVTGLHDVTASAIGTGCVKPGQLCLIAGTYSINEVISSQPALDARWFCRNGFRPGEWNNMAISPASSANSEWIMHQFFRDAVELANETGASVFNFVDDEVAAAFGHESRLIYHPFLFGSPRGGEASASLIGLQGWHRRGDVLRAVFEGIVFNHKEHVDVLRTRFPVTAATLAGGGARNPMFSQLFSDALDLEITVVDQEEVGALGVALAAGVGVGRYPSIDAASTATRRVLHRLYPDRDRHRDLSAAYKRYQEAIERVAPLWHALRI
ncbi:MAG: carbohydrate kinase [Hyphomicrobiales bacterium]|nr:carbohydrate kinase [Hyphomicrobiales bacterium]